MAERKAELERKKAKLEAMKQERIKKEEDKRKTAVSHEIGYVDRVVFMYANSILCMCHPYINMSVASDCVKMGK
jgi:hypothetical protein